MLCMDSPNMTAFEKGASVKIHLAEICTLTNAFYVVLVVYYCCHQLICLIADCSVVLSYWKFLFFGINFQHRIERVRKIDVRTHH